jgi:hypothetical protein
MRACRLVPSSRPLRTNSGRPGLSAPDREERVMPNVLLDARRPSPITGHEAGLQLRLPAAQRGSAIGEIATPRGTGRSPPRGRRGRLGLGATPALADRPRRAARRPVVLHPHRADQRPLRRSPASGDDSLRTSSDTPTQSRWRARASRSSSSDASSETPTSASRRSISKASTAPRSSTPPTRVARRSCRSAARRGPERSWRPASGQRSVQPFAYSSAARDSNSNPTNRSSPTTQAS